MRSWGVVCPLCGQRRARRACPALGHEICAVCCGTKRKVEINCPDDCVYLKTSQAHPPAVVQRRRERDLSLLVPTLAGLTERQTEIFFVIATFLIGYRPDGFQRLADADVAEAASALAATFETALKGVIYEHRPASLPAQRLMSDLRKFLADVGQRGGSSFERDAAASLRRVEQGASEVGKSAQEGDLAYLELLGRLVSRSTAPPDENPGSAPPSLISGV